MTIIHVKKIRRPDGEVDGYAVPCMAIVTPDGRRLIPNPSGTEAQVFDSLQEAGEAIRRAGFDYEFEGRTTHILAQPTGPSSPMTVLTGRPLEDSIPRLIELLSDRESQVVANAAAALGALRAQAALEELSRILGHDDPSVRKSAAEALARLGVPALHTLRESMGRARVITHSNALYIRLSVLLAYSEMIQQGLDSNLMGHFLPQVAECLKDDSWLVRAQAAQVMTQAAFAIERQQSDLKAKR
jgi:HEAT repeat protein